MVGLRLVGVERRGGGGGVEADVVIVRQDVVLLQMLGRAAIFVPLFLFFSFSSRRLFFLHVSTATISRGLKIN